MLIRQNAQYLRVKEFSEKIGLSESTVRRYEREGKLLPHHKTPTGIRYYSQEQADAWNERKTADTEATASLLTDKQYAEAVGLTIQTIRNYESRKLITPCFVAFDGSKYYSHEQVEAYFNGDYLRVRAKPQKQSDDGQTT